MSIHHGITKLGLQTCNFEKKKPNVHQKNWTKHEHNPKTSLELKKHKMGNNKSQT
jgi:hypothetical protein